MAITTQSAKSKGRKLQQLVRDAILASYTELQPADVRSCPMGSQGEDIQLSPAAQKRFPYSVECKAKARGFTPLYEALAQADGQNDRTPVAVVKQDRREPLVIMRLRDWLDIVKER